MYIFGIGLSRTGTKSLADALKILGYNSYHWPVTPETLRDVERGNWNMHIMQTHDAIIDCALPIVGYAKYRDMYPDSKFILTVRPIRPWLESITHLWRGLDQRYNCWEDKYDDLPIEAKCVKLYRLQIYGQLSTDQEHFKTVHERHINNVLEAFSEQNHRLLVLDVTHGWAPLCEFLDKPIPSEPFPWSNKRA